jgi:ammonia channel protein AmtB
MDVVHPWVALLIAFGAPFAFWFVYRLLIRLRIDEKKIVPLGLGAGIYGAIVSGFVAWHTPTGGYFGLRGAYGFQHAHMSPWMQLAGVGVTVAVAIVTGLVVIVALEKTMGLRVKEQDELLGLDAVNWGAPPEPVADYAPVIGNGEGTPGVAPASTPAGLGSDLLRE